MPYPLHFRPISYAPQPRTTVSQWPPTPRYSENVDPSPSFFRRRQSSVYTDRRPSKDSVLTAIFRRKSSAYAPILANPFRRKSSARTPITPQDDPDDRYEYDPSRISYFSDSDNASTHSGPDDTGSTRSKRDSGAILRPKAGRRKLVRRSVAPGHPPEPVAMSGRRLSAMGGERSRDVVAELIQEITHRLSGGGFGAGRREGGAAREENLMVKQGIAAKDRRRRLKKGMKRWSEEPEDEYPEWI